MRWLQSQDGDKREVTKFLLLPRCINGEWRWLERATFRQFMCRGHDCLPTAWINTEWIDK